MEEKEVVTDYEKVRQNIGRSVEEGLIILLVLLGIIKFVGLLPGDIDFLSNLASWITLGYLFYEISFTKLFFGSKEGIFDMILLASIFLLQIKDYLLYFSKGTDVLSVKGQAIFHDLFVYSLQNQEQILYVTFSIGTAIIIALSIYFGMNAKPTEGSIMFAISGETKETESFFSKLKKIIMNYLVIMSVYLFIVSPLLEWIAISLDAPLVVIAIAFYITQSKRFNPQTIIFKLGDFGENIFESFINLFKSKSTFFLGIFSIFGVKLVVDMISYIFPLITSYQFSYYLKFDQTHQPLWNLFNSQILNSSVIQIINLGLAYIFNIIAIFLIFLIPGFIWYSLYKKKRYEINNFLISLYFLSASCYVLYPLFKMKSIVGDKMVGVDITTQIITQNLAWIYLILLCSISLFFFLKLGIVKRISLIICGISSLVFLTIYFVYFFISTYQYYINSLSYFYSQSQYYFFSIFITFFITNIVFYIVGYLSFILEYKQEFRNIY